MKKLVTLLILVLIGLNSNGQGQPIQSYRENDYSIAEIKNFALARTELSSIWRQELLETVNTGLAIAGENIVLDERNIFWILDHVVYERRKLTSFTNSRKIGNKIEFFSDYNYDGMVGVFKYGKCSLVIFKTRCVNLLRVPPEIVQNAPSTVDFEFSKPKPAFKTTTTWEQYQAPNNTYESVLEDRVVDLHLPKPSPTKRTEIKIGFIAIPIGVIALGGLTYLLLKKSSSLPYPYDTGGPGGAPTTRDNGRPSGTPVTPDTGGPGGAPTTP
jgi:hypothetical protein